MKQEILVVDDTFKITGRGGIAVCGLHNDEIHLRVGDAIEIVRPDKTTITSEVAGIEMINYKCFGERRSLGFQIENLSKDDVPKGSTVFLIKD